MGEKSNCISVVVQVNVFGWEREWEWEWEWKWERYRPRQREISSQSPKRPTYCEKRRVAKTGVDCVAGRIMPRGINYRIGGWIKEYKQFIVSYICAISMT
jgi:hypothetical protein